MLNASILQQLQTMAEQTARHELDSAGDGKASADGVSASGRFLYQLARASTARRILEIAFGGGLSCVWLALAAQASQGHVTRLDSSGDRQQQVLADLESFDLSARVTLLTVDVGVWLARLETSPIDFVFLDADQSAYIDWWPPIQRVLRPGGIVVMDKARARESECAEFIATVLATPGYLAETYPIGEGLFVILKDE